MKFVMERFGQPYNPQKEEKQKNKIKTHIIIFFLVFIIVTAIFTLVIAKIIQRNISVFSVENELESIWIGSLASYLGGTLGGIFSGAFAFLGVFYTIKYYKDSDNQKEKSAIQPFLLVTSGAKSTISGRFEFENDRMPRNTKKHINLTIKNIGNGFASLLVVRTNFNIGGLEYNKVLCIGEESYIQLLFNPQTLENEVEFELQYVDAMRNEYSQKYKIKEINEKIDISSGYPIYIKQI